LKPELTPRFTPAASVKPTPGGGLSPLTTDGWQLTIPDGPAGRYRLAQLDDYAALPRRSFRWRPPLTFSLRARASAPSLPGTWGFELWNDPFGLSLGFGETAGRLPILPNTAWFFHASPPNYLSFRDDLPTQGFLATAFRSPRWPSLLLAPGLLALPLLILQPTRRWLRRMLGRFIQQDAAALSLDVTQWHQYRLNWEEKQVIFYVDEARVLATAISPHAPLALVLWIDNQYAVFTPQGQLGYGTLANPLPCWLELENILVNQKHGIQNNII
jgi:hypothetical protein